MHKTLYCVPCVSSLLADSGWQITLHHYSMAEEAIQDREPLEHICMNKVYSYRRTAI